MCGLLFGCFAFLSGAYVIWSGLSTSSPWVSKIRLVGAGASWMFFGFGLITLCCFDPYEKHPRFDLIYMLVLIFGPFLLSRLLAAIIDERHRF